MTQYYEPEAQRFESLGNMAQDARTQHYYWGKAAEIGTPVEYDEDGDEIWPNPNEVES